MRTYSGRKINWKIDTFQAVTFIEPKTPINNNKFNMITIQDMISETEKTDSETVFSLLPSGLNQRTTGKFT